MPFEISRAALIAAIALVSIPVAPVKAADAFVSNEKGNTVSVIDTGARSVLTTIPVGKRPWGMALTHDGKKLYVANGRSNSVSVIDTVTLAVIKEVPVGVLPWGVSIP